MQKLLLQGLYHQREDLPETLCLDEENSIYRWPQPISSRFEFQKFKLHNV